MNNKLYERAKAAKPQSEFGIDITREGPDEVRLLVQTESDHVVIRLEAKEAVKMGVALIQAAWPQ